MQRLDMLDPHLNRRTLSFLKNVLLYEQLMHPLMNNIQLIWWSITHTHIRILQLLQHKGLNIVINAHWYSYISNKQIYKGLDILLFVDHIRSLMKGSKSKLAGVGNPLLWELELVKGCL